MKIEITKPRGAGTVRVDWVQSVPTGESRLAHVLPVVSVIVILIAAYYWDAAGPFVAIFVSGFIIFLLLAIWRFPPVRDALKAPALKKTRAVIESWPPAERGIIVSWYSYDRTKKGVPLTSKKRVPIIETVLLNDIISFELDNYGKWFTPPHTKGDLLSEALAIVVHGRPGGPVPVAIHAGARAELIQLHEVLTRLFITEHAALLQPPSSLGEKSPNNGLPPSL